MDDGIGIEPSQFSDTILSLHKGNKIDKPYLIGAFGQGGSSALAFCSFALIASRAKVAPRNVGFTVIRVLRLGEEYKEDCFAYLTTPAPQGGQRILSAAIDDSLALYQSDERLRCPTFQKGTLVRHVGYRLAGLDKTLQASPGNLWHYLNAVVFDPLIPFRLLDLRDAQGSRHRNEVIVGSRNRLLGLSSGPSEGDDSGSQLRFYRPPEYVVPMGATTPCVTIEYWVVFNFKKKEKGSELRSNSNELYVQTNHPIVGTLNGQNQGELTAQLIRECGYPLLSRHMVIHIDATNAERRVRRELFATTREGFKEGPALSSILDQLKKMLQEDENLIQLEKELTERFTQRESETAKDEVKREITRLLREAGFQIQSEGPTDAEGTGQMAVVPRPPRPLPPNPPKPLPTLPYPQVTRFEIVWPKDKLDVPIGDSRSVLIETDADAEYDRQGRISVRAVPPLLELASKAPLRGGRIRWRMRAVVDAKAGQTGALFATLTKPDGTQLESQIPFNILLPEEKPSRRTSGFVPPFDVRPIDPEKNSEQWQMLWTDSIWPQVSGENATEAHTVAYKVESVGGKTIVYYSTIFEPYRSQIEKLKSVGQMQLESFRSNYEIWIGYHAILQERNKAVELAHLEEDQREKILERERQTVARVQVRQALRIADLIARAAQKTD